TTLTLTGTARAISDYINVADRIRFNGTASSTTYSLTVTSQSREGMTVRSAASALATLTAVASGSAATSGTAQAFAPLTLNLPASFSALSGSGEIRIASLVGTGSDSVTVLLGVSGGPSGALPAPTLVAPAGTASGVTVSGSGTATLTLSGSTSSVSTYLNTAGRVLFSGQASNTSYTLSATVQSVVSGVVRSARTAQAALTSVQLMTGANGSVTPLAPPTLNLPSAITTLAANGPIRIALPTTPTLSDGLVGTSTTDTVTVVMAVSGGPSDAAPRLSSALGNGLAEGVTVGGNDSSTLTLTGTASAISNYFNIADRILFNGAASTTAYSLAVTVQSRDGATVRSATTSTAALTSVASGTAAVTGTAQAAAAPVLNLAANLSAPSTNGELRISNLAGTGTETVTVLLALSGGPAGASPAPTLTVTSVAAGVAVTGSGTAALTLSGTAASI
ncbi:MAG: hypothetical protein EB027_07105, partial [Actinobacteria bacterium]|nr:hypothetical protein [Actinomycetota bacterium]